MTSPFLDQLSLKLNIRLLTKHFSPFVQSALIFIGPFTKNVERALDVLRWGKFDRLQLHYHCLPHEKKFIRWKEDLRGIICKRALWDGAERRSSSLDALKASSSHALRPALATLLISYIPYENYLAEFTLFRGNASCEIMKLQCLVQ